MPQVHLGMSVSVHVYVHANKYINVIKIKNKKKFHVFLMFKILLAMFNPSLSTWANQSLQSY